jgi:hypothetical protein
LDGRYSYENMQYIILLAREYSTYQCVWRGIYHSILTSIIVEVIEVILIAHPLDNQCRKYSTVDTMQPINWAVMCDTIWGFGFNKVPCTRINGTLVSPLTYSLPYLILADQLELGKYSTLVPDSIMKYKWRMETARASRHMMTSHVLRDIIPFLKALISRPKRSVCVNRMRGNLISIMSAFDTDRTANAW